jgi:hypothetical protein
MEKSDITYDMVSEEMENFIIQDIINQFKPIEHDTNEEKGEDISKISYNNYYINQGVDYIKRNVKLNDPLLNLIFEKEAENITTPLDEWNMRDFKNNNLDNNNDLK